MCVCLCVVVSVKFGPCNASSFSYRESITLSNCVLNFIFTHSHTLFHLYAHSKLILYNCSFSFCFLQYEHVFSSVRLY